MRSEDLTFYSDGERVSGTLHLPDQPEGAPAGGIVHGPGFLGLKDAKHYLRIYERFTGAGYAVLAFDYRGFGASEGERGLLLPSRQVEDIRNAITYMQTRPEVDPNRIGLFGLGGTGGGNAVYVAAVDPRVACVACYIGIGNGREWLRAMRREYEWLDFLSRLAEDRKQRALTGKGEFVDPRFEIMVETPERKASMLKKAVDQKIPETIPLRCAEAIMDFSPEDVVHRISPRASLFICIENDPVTPEEQTYRMYERAGDPKKLVVLRGTTHYGAYDDSFEEIVKPTLDWYHRYLTYDRVRVLSSTQPSAFSDQHGRET